MAGGASSFGVSGDFVMGLSDMLDEHKLVAQAYVNYLPTVGLLDTSLGFQYLNVREKIHYGVGAQFSQQNYITTDQPVTNAQSFVGFTERSYGAEFLAYYPFDKYMRLELSVGVGAFSRWYTGDVTNTIASLYPKRDGFLGTFHTAWVYDNTLWGQLHPMDNSRAIVLFEGAPPIGSSFSYFKAMLDARKYFLIGRNSSLAIRAMVGGVWGSNAGEYEFRVGGSGNFDILYYTSENYPTLHSYAPYSLRGNYMHLINLEYRFQFIDHITFGWPVPWSIGRFSAVTFIDMGGVTSNPSSYRLWNLEPDRLVLQDLKVSLGFGIRFIFLIFPLKLDFSTPWTGYSIKEPKNWDAFLSIGYDF
jgi:outer membrane protein assembly factor BamA